MSDEKLEEYQVLGSRMFTELATGTRDYSTFVSCAPPRNMPRNRGSDGAPPTVQFPSDVSFMPDRDPLESSSGFRMILAPASDLPLIPPR